MESMTYVRQLGCRTCAGLPVAGHLPDLPATFAGLPAMRSESRLELPGDGRQHFRWPIAGVDTGYKRKLSARQ